MSMRKSTYSRVQSFPSPESAAIPPLSDQLSAHKLKTSRISAGHLCKILHAATTAQKTGNSLAMAAISPATATTFDCRFINRYLDGTVLLLDACASIQLRLQSFSGCLASILAGLHFLEGGEHVPCMAVMQRVAASLDFSRFSSNAFGAKSHSASTPPHQAGGDRVSPDLHKALTGTWQTAALAVGLLSSATTFRSTTNPSVQAVKIEPWAMVLGELSGKKKGFPKKANKTASMEELAGTHLAVQALRKLVSTWRRGDDSSLRRVTVKAVAGELRRRGEELKKALPVLEENAKALYDQIVALRINLLGLLSKAEENDDGLVIMEPYCGYEDGRMETNNKPERYGRTATWVKIKTKMTRRSCSVGRIKPPCVGFIKKKIVGSTHILHAFKM